jgi:HlyD family secretion protein
MKRFLIIAVLAIVALGALIWSQFRRPAFYVSGFVEAHQVRVGSRVGGRIAAIHVVEGQEVTPGATLIELEPFDLQEKLTEARATLASRRAVLDKLRAGARPEELAQARAARDRAQAVLDKAVAGPRPLEIQVAEEQVTLTGAELAKAQKDFERVARLRETGQAAQEEMDDVTRARDVAVARHEQARSQLALLREGTRQEDIAEARARLDEAAQTVALLEAGTRQEDVAQAEANVAAGAAAAAAIEQQLRELAVTAPLAGTVEAFDLRPGDLIAPGAPVVALNDPAELWVRAYLPENRLRLQLNDRVAVRVDSYPARRFAGHVTFIARQAEFTPANVQTPEERSKQVFRIKVTLDEGRDVLRPGMPADVYLEPGP